jgi:DNA-binding NarL/FixJ family response regulator
VLVGRGRELDRIDDLLNQARASRSGVLAFVGGPGVGKTTLCREAVRRAAGFRVVHLTAFEPEAELPLAVVGDLLRGLRHDSNGLMSQVHSMAQALDAWSPSAHADWLALGVALLGLHVALSEREPLLVAVDDVQWVDGPSLDAFMFAWRRLNHDPIAVVVTSRPPPTPALATLGAIEVIGGLGSEPATELLRATAPVPIADPVARRLVEMTDGNALALTEVSRQLTAEQLSGSAPLPSSLPSSARLDASFGAAIRELTPDARLALAALALSGSTGGHAIAALGQLGLDTSALDPAIDQQLCEVADGHLRLRHPVIAAVAVSSVSANECRRIHAALAEVSRHSDPVWSAINLAQAVAGPSDRVATALEVAADAARARGGVVAAAPILARAAELTPSGQLREQRLLDAATAALFGGHLDLVFALTGRMRAESPHSPLLPMAIILEGRASLWRGWNDDLVEELWAVADDPNLAPAALEAVMPLLVNRCDYGRMVVTIPRVRQLIGDDVTTSAALMADLTDAVIGNRNVDRLRQAADTLLNAEIVGDDAIIRCGYAALACSFVEEHERSLALGTAAIEHIRRAGAVSALPFMLTVVGQAAWWCGRTHQARAALDEAVRVADDTGQQGMGGFAHGLLARIYATQGDRNRALTHGSSARMVAEEYEFRPCQVYDDHARGHVALVQGNVEDAAHALIAALRLLDELVGVDGDVILVPLHGDLAEALIRLKRFNEAGEVLARLDRHRGYSAWCRVVAARCRGLLPEEDWEERFRDAAAETGSGLALEHARSELNFGERLRRVRRNAEARQHLITAVDNFEQLGARAWAVRARDELRALGVRVATPRPTLETLTPQELRVCLAVAEGASNREAAAALFVSPKTVETHLSSAFRKLNVTSRTQMARLVTAAGPDRHRLDRVR